jgi:hypothetical protein
MKNPLRLCYVSGGDYVLEVGVNLKGERGLFHGMKGLKQGLG